MYLPCIENGSANDSGLEVMAWERELSGQDFFEIKESSITFNFLLIIHQVILVFPKYQSWQNLESGTFVSPHLYLESITQKPANCTHEADGGVCLCVYENYLLAYSGIVHISISGPSHHFGVTHSCLCSSDPCLMLLSLQWGTQLSDEIFDLQPFYSYFYLYFC